MGILSGQVRYIVRRPMRARDSARQTVLLVRGHLNFGRIVGVEGSVRLFRMLEEIRSFVARGKDVLPNVALWPPASQIPPSIRNSVPTLSQILIHLIDQ